MAAPGETTSPAEEPKPAEKEPTFTKKDAPGKAIPQKFVQVDDEDEGEDEDEDEAEKGNQDEDADNNKSGGKNQHIELIKKLRLQLRDLEKYAFEKGELRQIPVSVLAERQTMILDILREKLSLNISTKELEKLGLDELRKQVDKEIEDLKRKHSLEKLAPTTESPAPQKFQKEVVPTTHCESAWTSHVDTITLATDSLMNLFTTSTITTSKANGSQTASVDKLLDPELVESVVRKQLVPSIRDYLSFGLIDPETLGQPNSYTSLFFNPYYILASLTCFPLGQKHTKSLGERGSIENKIHIWHVIEDYHKERNEVDFKNSSIRALSQSFSLESSINGSIKLSSKQALLIAIDGIISTLSNCKPNGPESHFKAFIYTALNRNKLTDWLRLIFKNKSIVRKHYHTHSFLNQPEKSDKFLAVLKPLNKFEFKLNNDVEPIEQFVSAF